MPSRASFERRLLVVLVLFATLPALLLLGAGGYAVMRGISLGGSPAAWERTADSARELLERVEQLDDPMLAAAAERHREELTGSLVQARRWEYVLQRSLAPLAAGLLVLAALIVWLAVRSARGMARELARPIRTLVGWAGRIGRGAELPPPLPGEAERADEFGILRAAFRSMSAELAASRARALEAERMQAWVRMARGVAHELKNPLTPMRLALRTLERRADPEDEAGREALEVLAAEAARLEELARSFSQFGRLPEGAPSEVDLRELFEYLLRTHLPAHVESRIDAPAELPRPLGHYDALARAFANLLLNAQEAMGDAGGSVLVTLAPAGDAVEVRVADSGPGIAAEYLARVWEPDFTTKSSGTGLGLALVRQTVQAHGGEATAHNRPQGGAEFVVRLPLAPRAASGAEPALAAQPALR